MKNFRNDKERIEFLENYRSEENGWRLWKEDEEMKRRWWRLDLPDGTPLIVEEELRRFNMYEPAEHGFKKHEKWNVIMWYILEPGKYFGDCRGSRTLALAKLKELGRKKK